LGKPGGKKGQVALQVNERHGGRSHEGTRGGKKWDQAPKKESERRGGGVANHINSEVKKKGRGRTKRPGPARKGEVKQGEFLSVDKIKRSNVAVTQKTKRAGGGGKR